MTPSKFERRFLRLMARLARCSNAWDDVQAGEWERTFAKLVDLEAEMRGAYGAEAAA